MSGHQEDLKLANAFRTIVRAIIERDIDDLRNLTNEHFSSRMTFLASIVEGVDAPEKSLSARQKQFVLGTLLYSLQHLKVENEDERMDFRDAFSSLEGGVEVLCALIEQEKKLYR